MATRLASSSGPMAHQHSAGIFADMTVDGPEIGTFVMIVDRAKNLPNRKTMGKQNPYCAARLGKEAKKTETDKRGGQTPRWDQELRFTVHDSPDYYTLKVSVFSEDKRTDLIGEAFVSLSDVVIPGGGKRDVWQGLNCKGKYAGEVRIEMTYYDSRPKPEISRESSFGDEDARTISGSGKVKRRPLPGLNGSRGMTPGTISDPFALSPVPGRAKHGPRELGMPARANSMPPEMPYHDEVPHRALSGAPQYHPQQFAQSDQGSYDEPQTCDDSYAYDKLPHEQQYAQPDFLPQLPPSNRSRGTTPQSVRQPFANPPIQAHQRSQSQGLQHTHSAPQIPTMESDYHPGFSLHTEAPQPLPDLDFQHQHLLHRQYDAPQEWENPYESSYDVERPMEDGAGRPPPPPPQHSHSAPVVPQYSPTRSPAGTPYGAAPSPAQPYVNHASPLQSIEQEYGQARYTPARSYASHAHSVDEHASPGSHIASRNSTPQSLVIGHSPSPAARSPAARVTAHRHSVADPYQATPPRPHPLSQEVPRARSPLPELPVDHDVSYNQPAYRSREHLPMIKPRAISPGASASQPSSAPQSQRGPKSSYSLQYPVRAFESADESPLSTSRPSPRPAPASIRSTPIRKSVSAATSPIAGPAPNDSIPFGPDSFDVHNPHTSARTLTSSASNPSSPYHIRPDQAPTPDRDDSSGPIVGWDGREIDPSDHLPVDSWAPEPIKKTPTKTYGLGRDKDFGLRSGENSPGMGQRLSKDTVVKFGRKSATQAPPPQLPELSPPNSRNRLRKATSETARGAPTTPLREHTNFNAIPDPYAQQEYSRGFHGDSPRGYEHQQPRYDQVNQDHGGYAPELPPKVPFDHRRGSYVQEDDLSREIAGIDLGATTGSTRRMANGGYDSGRTSRDGKGRHY
ncbi:hypothetical protein B0A48_17259 [Cryoendolithus antarcticus]|uniref:C2 domain-containing protein n=1 Tax=Cryoendolithus antarcticus TaxID=1507870 RepID=A0A1V8SDD1_9PEZI|nr:hypothetical protein B0A48_17259 [Cryoendolithus antarcticus]